MIKVLKLPHRPHASWDVINACYKSYIGSGHRIHALDSDKPPGGDNLSARGRPWTITGGISRIIPPSIVAHPGDDGGGGRGEGGKGEYSARKWEVNVDGLV